VSEFPWVALTHGVEGQEHVGCTTCQLAGVPVSLECHLGGIKTHEKSKKHLKAISFASESAKARAKLNKATVLNFTYEKNIWVVN
jgi:hypothetical protein